MLSTSFCSWTALAGMALTHLLVSAQKAGDFMCIDDTRFQHFSSATQFVIESCPAGFCATRDPPFKNPCIGKANADRIDAAAKAKVAKRTLSRVSSSQLETTSQNLSTSVNGSASQNGTNAASAGKGQANTANAVKVRNNNNEALQNRTASAVKSKANSQGQATNLMKNKGSGSATASAVQVNNTASLNNTQIVKAAAAQKMKLGQQMKSLVQGAASQNKVSASNSSVDSSSSNASASVASPKCKVA